MGRAEATQTGVVYLQRYHSLPLSVAYRYLGNEWNTDIINELSNLGYCQKSPIQPFFINCLRLGLLFEACSPNADVGSVQNCLVTADSRHSSVSGLIFLIHECSNNKIKMTGKKKLFFCILVTCALSMKQIVS